MKHITLLILLIIALVLSCSDKKPENHKETVLIELAKKEILSRLKAPSTASFIDSLNSVSQFKDDKNLYNVRISVDAQNSFGAIIRNRYIVIYKSIGNDSLNISNYVLENFLD